MKEKDLPELSVYRIGELEIDVRGLKDDIGSLTTVVNKIKNNHLVHLKSQITDVKTELKGELKSTNTRVAMGVAVNIVQVVALIVGLVLIFKK